MSINNLKQLDEPTAPASLQRKVRSSVQTNLGLLRFVSNVMDLYLGSAVQVFSGMVETFEDKERITKPSTPSEESDKK